MDKIKKVGEVSVDAGMCWVGDPCYILHADKTPEDIGKDWSGFCDKMAEGCEGGGVLDQRQFNFNGGHAGLGVCIGGFGGDGTYPVYIKLGADGYTKEIRIVFENDEDEDYDYDED